MHVFCLLIEVIVFLKVLVAVAVIGYKGSKVFCDYVVLFIIIFLYSFEPSPNSHALATAGSIMTMGHIN